MRAKFSDISWWEKPKVRPHSPTNSLARGVLSNLAWRSLPPGDHHGTQDRMITVFKLWPQVFDRMINFWPPGLPRHLKHNGSVEVDVSSPPWISQGDQVVIFEEKNTFMLRQMLLKVEVDEQRRNCKTYSFLVPFSQAWISYRVQSWPTSE